MGSELELVCPACHATELCGPTQMLSRLRSISLLKRDAQPDLILVRELFQCSADRLTCQTCQSIGLTVRQPQKVDWGDRRQCADCSAEIPAERLEVFPNAERCVRCEKQSSTAEGEREFCPKCGDVLTLRRRGGAGIAKYELFCPSCRR